MTDPGGTVTTDAGATEPSGAVAGAEAAEPATEPSANAVDVDRLVALIVGGAALLMAVGFFPDTADLFGMPRKVLGFAVGAAGLVLLARLAARRDSAALALAGFLGWSLLSGFLSSQPALSILAGPILDAGWIFLATFAGWWAVGRHLGDTGRRFLTGALVVGGLGNVALAAVQVHHGGGRGILHFGHQRAMGFLGNPVFLGAYLAGAAALVIITLHRTTRARWWLGLPVVAVLAAGINLAGSRVALVGSVAVVALPLLRTRWLRSLALAAAFAVGVLVTLDALPASGTSRVAGGVSDGGLTTRVEVWKAGAAATGDRPLLGWGPGRFAEPTLPRVTLRQAQSSSPAGVHADAHNVVVELAATTGVVGLALAGAFTALALRRARGPLAYFAAGVAITWLLEPVVIYTAPIALLALGAAGGRRDGSTPASGADGTRRRSPRLVAAAVALAAVIGLGISVPYVLAAQEMAEPGTMDRTDGALAAARRAADRFPHDPDTASRVAYVLTWRAIGDSTPESAEAAIAARRHVVDLDPSFGPWWGALAYTREMVAARDEPGLRQTRAEYLEALDRVAWSLPALQGLHRVAVKLGDDDEAAEWARRLCLLDECPTPETTPDGPLVGPDAIRPATSGGTAGAGRGG